MALRSIYRRDTGNHLTTAAATDKQVLQDSPLTDQESDK
jgi:hypothetical protein